MQAIGVLRAHTSWASGSIGCDGTGETAQNRASRSDLWGPQVFVSPRSTTPVSASTTVWNASVLLAPSICHQQRRPPALSIQRNPVVRHQIATVGACEELGHVPVLIARIPSTHLAPETVLASAPEHDLLSSSLDSKPGTICRAHKSFHAIRQLGQWSNLLSSTVTV